MDLAGLMHLEQHGPDTWVGVGPQYPWGGLYGGQIVAQALAAATRTVEATHRVHSVHAYFIRLGDASEPIRFEVDRLRNGRSFATRHVVARQATGAILNLAASFHAEEHDVEVQPLVTPRDVPGPDGLPSTSWSPVFERRLVPRDDDGVVRGWLRTTADLDPDDVQAHAFALAYLSDDLPTDAVVTRHPDWQAAGEWDEQFWSASLDHAIWFHGPFRADQWHLHELTCSVLRGSRGLATAKVFDGSGRHVASISQEVLLRRRRP